MSTFKADYIIARQEEIAGNTSSIPVKTVVNGTAKAWVNFNGTGTIAIRSSFNTSSITDGGVGIYTSNFTNALSDANFCPSGSAGVPAGSIGQFQTYWVAPTASTCSASSRNNAGSFADFDYVALLIMYR